MTRTCHSFPTRRRAGAVVESRLDRPWLTTCIWGRYALSASSSLYIAFCGCDAMLTKYSSRSDIVEIPSRYLSASSLCLGNDGRSSLMQKSTVMKNEKLKATTVRFTDSELRLIDRLRDKLGLGMIHIIRLAIRRLAENENLLPSNSALTKR